MEPSGVWAESDSLGIPLLWQAVRRGALCAVLQQNPEALDRPRLLVQAMDALAKSQSAEEGLLKSMSKQIVYHMVDFSVKDLATTANACQRMLVKDGAILESLVRQGLRKGWRFKPVSAEAVIRACDAAGFRHPQLVELREGLEQQKNSASTREAPPPRPELQAEVDWETVEEGPLFDDVAAKAQDAEELKKASEPPASGSVSTSKGSEASEAIGQRRRREPEVAERSSPQIVAADKEVRKVLRDVEKKVLRPFGLKSFVLQQSRNRKR
ncbi:amtB [Symbiodinium sp. CCMP2592]|nr:amtB [Symbiodinium sp. CCMP2592]